ncbi:Uncharacterised protein r2_g721 [Pycnogonum litorale]
MKSLARLNVWWPDIDLQIESVVTECVSCQQTAPSPSTEGSEPWPAARPWQRVHLDYGSFNGRDFLILVDAGSKWIEAEFVKSTSSESTLRLLFSWFSRFGMPEAVHTDGGPQFTSAEFRDKMRDWNIRHTVSSPYHPQSNGMAERAVRIVKESLKRNLSNGSKLQSILFRYRATPLCPASDKSPAQLLLGRSIRNKLSSLLKIAT